MKNVLHVYDSMFLTELNYYLSGETIYRRAASSVGVICTVPTVQTQGAIPEEWDRKKKVAQWYCMQNDTLSINPQNYGFLSK